MDIARITFVAKDTDSVLATMMFAGVGVAAAVVIFLLARHYCQKR